ncbi:MAG: hypothetical protein KAT00_13680 [Planctomycetes bacterium]|nr:hypothetical protein [Planctomycetota bacterium]
MSYTVGDFLKPKDETDEGFEDFQEAQERMAERSEEIENAVIGIWEGDNDQAECIAINGEVFKAA